MFSNSSIIFSIRKKIFLHNSTIIAEARLSKFLYYYLPLLITFTANIVLFISIALKIRQPQSTSGEEKTNLMNDKCVKNVVRLINCWFNIVFHCRFTLYLRLFVVMGILWTMEVLSFLIAPDHPVFFLTDIINTLHGVFIFILFILKRRVFQLIKERFVFGLIIIEANPLATIIISIFSIKDGRAYSVKVLKMEALQYTVLQIRMFLAQSVFILQRRTKQTNW